MRGGCRQILPGNLSGTELFLAQAVNRSTRTRRPKVAERARQAEAQFAGYVQSVATPANGSATELAKAKSLLDSGTISQGEFDTLKTKILA